MLLLPTRYHEAPRGIKGHARDTATVLRTLRGTPTMYYGDEIGMHDVDIPLE